MGTLWTPTTTREINLRSGCVALMLNMPRQEMALHTLSSFASALRFAFRGFIQNTEHPSRAPSEPINELKPPQPNDHLTTKGRLPACSGCSFQVDSGVVGPFRPAYCSDALGLSDRRWLRPRARGQESPPTGLKCKARPLHGWHEGLRCSTLKQGSTF